MLGFVTGTAGLMLVFLGQDWADALFRILAAAFLVVTMRDIIRCGLAMIVCFGAPLVWEVDRWKLLSLAPDA